MPKRAGSRIGSDRVRASRDVATEHGDDVQDADRRSSRRRRALANSVSTAGQGDRLQHAFAEPGHGTDFEAKECSIGGESGRRADVVKVWARSHGAEVSTARPAVSKRQGVVPSSLHKSPAIASGRPKQIETSAFISGAAIQMNSIPAVRSCSGPTSAKENEAASRRSPTRGRRCDSSCVARREHVPRDPIVALVSRLSGSGPDHGDDGARQTLNPSRAQSSQARRGFGARRCWPTMRA